MQRLRKGDEVIVLSGADRGKRGTIERAIHKRGRLTHVIVTGLNQRWSHKRPNPQDNDPGGRVRKDMPLPACKVALYNEAKGGPDRVRIKMGEDGKRHRVFASDGGRI